MKSFIFFIVACVSFGIGTLVAQTAVSPQQKLKDSTVHIAIGTGFILETKRGNHYLITNWHVCNSGSWMGRVRANFEGGELIDGQIVKLDPAADLCAAKIPKRPSALKIANTLTPKEQIYTRGYPFGVLSETSGQYVGSQSWNYTYSLDEVGKCFKGSKEVNDVNGKLVGCVIIYRDNLTNMYSRPGSSGSPVVNGSGDLVGVMSSWISNKDLGGMVRLDQIQEFVRGL